MNRPSHALLDKPAHHAAPHCALVLLSLAEAY